MAVKQILEKHYQGLSTDTKPVDVISGTTFRETDTGTLHITYDGTNYIVKDNSVRWSYSHVAADKQVSAVPCVLHTIAVNGLTTAGDCTVYDSSDGVDAEAIIAVLHLDLTTSVSVQPITLWYDIECLTGLHLEFDGTLVADLTVSFK